MEMPNLRVCQFQGRYVLVLVFAVALSDLSVSASGTGGGKPFTGLSSSLLGRRSSYQVDYVGFQHEDLLATCSKLVQHAARRVPSLRKSFAGGSVKAVGVDSSARISTVEERGIDPQYARQPVLCSKRQNDIVGKTTVLASSTTLSEAPSTSSNLAALMDPLIPNFVWEKLNGREFTKDESLLDGLVETGLSLTSSSDSNDWIAWNKVDSTFQDDVEDGGIHVWTGKSKKGGKGSSVSYYGASLPFIKTHSIVPMTPTELIDLMLDSNRVKSYNPWSVGRKDLWTSPDGQTKIVQNKTQPPVGGKALIATTLLHARQVEPETWLLVSRAVGPNQHAEKNAGTSDILLGVNLVKSYGADESYLTALTHVYSSAVPAMLAERLGVKSSIKFVKDLRALVVGVSK